MGAASGIAAIDHLAFGGNPGFDAQALGNQPGDETVRDDDDHQFVAGVTVLGQQYDGLGRRSVRCSRACNRGATDPARLSRYDRALPAEVQVGIVIELAGQVILVELVVACLVGDGVEEAAFAQVIAPGVALTAQKRSMQVGSSRRIISLKSL